MSNSRDVPIEPPGRDRCNNIGNERTAIVIIVKAPGTHTFVRLVRIQVPLADVAGLVPGFPKQRPEGRQTGVEPLDGSIAEHAVIALDSDAGFNRFQPGHQAGSGGRALGIGTVGPR